MWRGQSVISTGSRKLFRNIHKKTTIRLSPKTFNQQLNSAKVGFQVNYHQFIFGRTFTSTSNQQENDSQIVQREFRKSSGDEWLIILGCIFSAVMFAYLQSSNEKKSNKSNKSEAGRKSSGLTFGPLQPNYISGNSNYKQNFNLNNEVTKEIKSVLDSADNVDNFLNFPTTEEIERTIVSIENEYKRFAINDKKELVKFSADEEDNFSIDTINQLFNDEHDIGKMVLNTPKILTECDTIDYLCEDPQHKHHRDYDFKADSRFVDDDDDDYEDYEDYEDYDDDYDEGDFESEGDLFDGVRTKKSSKDGGDYIPASVVPSSPKLGFNSVEYPYTDRMGEREYAEEKFKLQIELLKMQRWVKETGAKIVVLVEGRDAAGKGGTIKRLTENLYPRGTRVVALDKPTDDEKTQWFFQRYVRHLPHEGEIVFYDRSWYNRAGVELVMGFCTFQQYLEFMKSVPYFEEMLVNSGIFLIKFWFSVTREEQSQRFDARATDKLKQWKLSPMDLESRNRWDQYAVAKEIMFSHSDRSFAPWVIIRSNDKFRARLNAMRVLLSAIPYDGKDEELVSKIDTHIVGSPKRAYKYPLAKGEPLFTESQVALMKKHLIIDGVQINYSSDPENPPPESTPIHYWSPEELPPEPRVTIRTKKKSQKSSESSIL